MKSASHEKVRVEAYFPPIPYTADGDARQARGVRGTHCSTPTLPLGLGSFTSRKKIGATPEVCRTDS
jgi:hypothetical protein